MRILKHLLLFQFACFIGTSLIAQTPADEIVDYENFDAALFNETVFEMINEERKKRRRKVFRFKKKLEETAYVELQKRSYRYFKPDFRRKQRLLKYLQKQRRATGYQGSYLDCSFAYLPVIQYDQKQKYIYRLDEGEQVDFFYYYGKAEKPVEIKQHTYHSLAKLALKKMSTLGAKNFGRTKLYQDFVCTVSIVQKDEKRMPYIKVLCVLGGYRLSFLK